MKGLLLIMRMLQNKANIQINQLSIIHQHPQPTPNHIRTFPNDKPIQQNPSFSKFNKISQINLSSRYPQIKIEQASRKNHKINEGNQKSEAQKSCPLNLVQQPRQGNQHISKRRILNVMNRKIQDLSQCQKANLSFQYLTDSISEIKENELQMNPTNIDFYQANYSRIFNNQWMRVLRSHHSSICSYDSDGQSEDQFFNEFPFVSQNIDNQDIVKYLASIENLNRIPIKRRQNLQIISEITASDESLRNTMCLKKRIEELQKKCESWNRKLKILQGKIWADFNEKDELKHRIQELLVQNDQLKYENYFREQQHWESYHKKLNEKTAEIQEYYLTISTDKSEEINNLNDQLYKLKQKYDQLLSRETILEGYSSFDKTIQELLIKDQHDENMVKLYEQLYEMLQKNEKLEKEVTKNKGIIKDLEQKLIYLESDKSSLINKQQRINKQLAQLRQQSKQNQNSQLQRDFKYEKQHKDFNEREKGYKSVINDKEKMFVVLQEKIDNLEQQLQQELSLTRQVWSLIQPLFNYQYDIKSLQVTENKQKILETLYNISSNHLVQPFYCQILKLFGIQTNLLSVSVHEELMQILLRLRENHDSLISHIHRIEENNLVLGRQLFTVGKINEGQSLIIQSINQELIKINLRNIALKRNRWY